MNNKIKKLKDINLNEREEDICDINTFGITKINNKINNNLFNIILLDKKSENKKYIKKPSFLSISNPEFNRETLGFKETKSENKDESCEKLQKRINGLFFNKDVLRKIRKEEKKKSISNNSLFLKKSNKSINFNDLKNNVIHPDINHQKQLKDNNINNNSTLTYIPNGNEDIKININNDSKNDEYQSNNSIFENINIDTISKQENTNNNKGNFIDKGNDKPKYKLKICHSFSSFPNILEKGIIN